MVGKVQRAWRQLQWSVAHRGIAATARAVFKRGLRKGDGRAPLVHPFDVRYGVDTSGLIGGGELSTGQANDRYITAYLGIAPSRFQQAMAWWQATDGALAVEETPFLDIGCGKGRAMMLASELGFREVVGVELNADLVRIAEENLARWKELRQARCPMSILQGDAAEVALPEGRLLVYLYNPFHAPVLRRVLQRLEEGTAGREIELMYLLPQEEAVFAEFPAFELLWSRTMGMSEEDRAADTASSSEDRCSLYRRRS
jgi:SAM-dependent methyltransferase